MARLSKHAAGYPVVFTNPTTGEPTHGKILDEVWATDPDNFAPTAPPNDGWREGGPVGYDRAPCGLVPTFVSIPCSP